MCRLPVVCIMPIKIPCYDSLPARGRCSCSLLTEDLSSFPVQSTSQAESWKPAVLCVQEVKWDIAGVQLLGCLESLRVLLSGNPVR